MRGWYWPRALVLIALTCVTSRSLAESQPLALEYDADATCPDQEAFSALVLEKLAANGVEESSSARPQIAAHIHEVHSSFVGQLSLGRSDTSNYEREVAGASCSEVANALAFVLALALGSEDATRFSSPSTPTVVRAPAAAAAAVPVPSVKPPVTLSAPEHAPKPAFDERSSPWRLGAGAQVGERTGLGSFTFVGSGFFEVRRIAASPLGFTFRAGASSAQTATLTDANATTKVSWWAGKLEACPLRLRIVESLSLLPCAAADVGRQSVMGIPNPGPGSRSAKASKVWLDGLAAARLELSLARWLSVEAEGELIVPLTRYRFVFNPDTRAYRAPAAATAAFAGLTGHFP